jgi:flavin reductase (DIM6/NTAB) family NADH-FMN oxidoreductase RutF
MKKQNSKVRIAMVDQIAPEELRAAMRHWATGVALVTVDDHNHGHGMTVNSFTSISLIPPLIMVSMEQTTRTHRLTLDDGRFAVAILREDQKDLSEIFAGRTSDEDNRFKGVEKEFSPSGIPVPTGTLAVFDCTVERTINAGTHTLFIARVKHIQISAGGPPLLYFNRDYHKFSK